MKNEKEFNSLQATFKRLLQFLSFVAFRTVYLNKFKNLSLTDDDIKRLCQLIGRVAVTKQINVWYESYKQFAATESVAAKEPTKETVEEPVAEEPVAEEPVAEEPVAEEPVAEEPVAEEPVAEEPAKETKKSAKSSKK